MYNDRNRYTKCQNKSQYIDSYLNDQKNIHFHQTWNKSMIFFKINVELE